MPYIAIVLDNESHLKAWAHALQNDLLRAGWNEKLHHVTLAMGKVSGFKIGSERKLTVTHYGKIDGRVYAYRVEGAEDSKNMFPHITITVAPDAKPVESNQIVEWTELLAPFTLKGKIEVCS